MPRAATASTDVKLGPGVYAVWGAAYATPNVGDMAIAQAVVRLVRHNEREARVAFVTSGSHDAHLLAQEGVTVVHPWRRPLRLMRLLRGSRLLLVAGGVPFGDSATSLLRFLALAAAARLAGTAVAVVAASAADARLRPLNEILCRTILLLIESIAVRDRKSLELLRRLKGEEAVDFVPDLVLALDLSSEADGTPFRPAGLGDEEPYVVIAPRNFLADRSYLRTHFAASFGEAEATELLASLGAVAETLGRERRIVFLPMNASEDDQAVGRRLAGRLTARGQAPVVLEDRLSVGQTCALIKGADLVLGMRLHAVVFAIALGRPTVALGYAGKVTGFMQWLGLEEDVVPLTAPSDELLEACRRRLVQGVPPHVAASLRQARDDIEQRFNALSQAS